MGGDWPHNQGSYNRGAGLDPRALMLRRGFGPSRLDATVRLRLALRLEFETLLLTTCLNDF